MKINLKNSNGPYIHSGTGCLAACALILLIVVLGLGFTCLVAWITTLVLAEFGVNIGFWTAFGIWFLLGAFANMIRTSSTKS